MAPNETASLLSPNDISYDRTEDNICTPSFLRNGKLFRAVMPSTPEEDRQQWGRNVMSRVSPYNGSCDGPFSTLICDCIMTDANACC